MASVNKKLPRDNLDENYEKVVKWNNNNNNNNNNNDTQNHKLSPLTQFPLHIVSPPFTPSAHTL